jgi:dissimilatory sulfite reductase (desulfoviridin) alpha/beta subunit
MSKSFQLTDGTLLISAEAPGGVYSTIQLAKIAELSEREAAFVKTTEDQRLALLVTSENVDSVRAELESVGLGMRDYQSGLHQPVSCLGNLCPKAQQDALSLSQTIAEELSGVVLDKKLRIGINGCSESCVPTHTLDLSLIGDMNGYRVSIGGKTTQLPVMASFIADAVPAEKIPEMLRSVINIYSEHANEDEALHEFIERQGLQAFIEAFAPYSQDAAQAEDDIFASSSTDDIETPPEAAVEEIPSSELLDESKDTFDGETDQLLEGFDEELDLSDVSLELNHEPIDSSDLSAEDFADEFEIDENNQTSSHLQLVQDHREANPEERAIDLSELEPEVLSDEEENALEERLSATIEEEKRAEMHLDLETGLERDQAIEMVGNAEPEYSDINHVSLNDDDLPDEEFHALEMTEDDNEQADKDFHSTGFSGLKFCTNGTPELIFASGVRLALSNLKADGTTSSFVIEQQIIKIEALEREFRIEIGGMGITVPRRKAA